MVFDRQGSTRPAGRPSSRWRESSRSRDAAYLGAPGRDRLRPACGVDHRQPGISFSGNAPRFSKSKQDCKRSTPIGVVTTHHRPRSTEWVEPKETVCATAGQACSGGSASRCRRCWSVPCAARPRPRCASAGRPTSRTALSAPTSTIMKEFKPLTSAGHGKVAAILPDTVSSTRYVELDAAGHHQGPLDGGSELIPLCGAERARQRRHAADRCPDRHLQRRHRAAGRPDRLRGRLADRILRQVPRRQSHRLRPPHPRREPRLLRRIQQRDRSARKWVRAS